MPERIQNITEELYALDPSLREEQGIEEIVEHMLLTKPAVSIDRHFVVSLRERLVKRSVQSALPIVSPWNLWMLRLTPVAGFALLLMILMPDFLGIQTETQTRVTPVPEMRTFEAVMAPKAAPQDTAITRGEDESGETSVSLMQLNDARQSDSFTMDKQTAGDSISIREVTLSAPGFVVVEQTQMGVRGDRTLGVSALLQAGTTLAVLVPLTLPTRGGETLAVILYHDDGDGRFVSTHDSVVYDQSGTAPLTTRFDVLSDAEEVE